MPSNKRLIPKTGKLANPDIPVEATNPKKVSQRYEADARGAADQDGNQEHARGQGAGGTPRRSADKPRHAKR
jgi:hypothetical protein